MLLPLYNNYLEYKPHKFTTVIGQDWLSFILILCLYLANVILMLQERCTAVDTISFVARVLHRSKPHLQSMLLQNNPAIVEDFFVNLVDTVPDLTEHIHRRTARLLLHIDGFIDRVANAKWEVKELGLEHNGYVDLLLEEFKHYRTRSKSNFWNMELNLLQTHLLRAYHV